jgi:DNA-binding PadR family transcriptional regulator
MSTKEEQGRIELLQGTLDRLILRTLLLGPRHGHAIAKTIELNCDEVLQLEQGSLYPALPRLIKLHGSQWKKEYQRTIAGRSFTGLLARGDGNWRSRRASGKSWRERLREF